MLPPFSEEGKTCSPSDLCPAGLFCLLDGDAGFCRKQACDPALAGTACDAGVGQCLATGILICNNPTQVLLQRRDAFSCNAQLRDAGQEICDGVDNDCNGTVDDGVLQDYDAGGLGGCLTLGVCADAGWACQHDGGWACSYGTDYEIRETRCDGQDNDCDGVPDHNDGGALPPRPVGSLGVCAQVLEYCQNGGWDAGSDLVDAGYEPVEVTCDGKDNDCDGVIDQKPNDAGELTPRQFGTVGVCAQAFAHCINGVWDAGADLAAVGYELSETSCDGKDNDCNGTVDLASNGAFITGPSSCGVGVCNVLQVCVPNGGGAFDCAGPIADAGAQSLETLCDGLDNDCDGTVDQSRVVSLVPAGATGDFALRRRVKGFDVVYVTQSATLLYAQYDDAFNPVGGTLSLSSNSPSSPVLPVGDAGTVGWLEGADLVVTRVLDGGQVAWLDGGLEPRLTLTSGVSSPLNAAQVRPGPIDTAFVWADGTGHPTGVLFYELLMTSVAGFGTPVQLDADAGARSVDIIAEAGSNPDHFNAAWNGSNEVVAAVLSSGLTGSVHDHVGGAPSNINEVRLGAYGTVFWADQSGIRVSALFDGGSGLGTGKLIADGGRNFARANTSNGELLVWEKGGPFVDQCVPQLSGPDAGTCANPIHVMPTSAGTAIQLAATNGDLVALAVGGDGGIYARYICAP